MATACLLMAKPHLSSKDPDLHTNDGTSNMVALLSFVRFLSIRTGLTISHHHHHTERQQLPFCMVMMVRYGESCSD